MSTDLPNIDVASTDPHPEINGVLLSDQIEQYVTQCKMIEPFNKDHLRAAAYDLTLGPEYIRCGLTKYLDSNNPTLEIKPHESVVIQARETLIMPRFMIGRWGPRLFLIYKGIIWVGGVHIDPGFKGKLQVPLYNLSNSPVFLKLGEVFASVDFCKTTAFSDNSKPYPGKQAQVEHTGSGLEKLRDDIEEFPHRIVEYQSRVERQQSMIFTILSIMVSAIAIIGIMPFAVNNDTKLADINFLYIVFGISIGAFALGITALGVSIQRRTANKNGYT